MVIIDIRKSLDKKIQLSRLTSVVQMKMSWHRPIAGSINSELFDACDSSRRVCIAFSLSFKYLEFIRL